MALKNEKLLEFFVKIEQEGQTFYKKLARHISDPVVKGYLLLMSGDEAEHEKNFKLLLGGKEDRKFGWEDDPAISQFVDAHHLEGLFPDLDEVLGNLPDPEGIQKALKLTQDSEQIAHTNGVLSIRPSGNHQKFCAGQFTQSFDVPPGVGR